MPRGWRDRSSTTGSAINRQVPRLVDVLPNGPHPTVRVYLAGGVPEVMLHLRRAGLLDTSVRTVTGESLDAVLDWWEASERRRALRARLLEADGVEADAVILSPDRAAARGLTPTVSFLRGNLAPDGAICKSTAIDPAVVGSDGVYRLTGPARVFTSERAAIAAIKSHGDDRILAGQVMVLICRGPMGAGMEEVYQVTSALKYLDVGKQVALVTDARFSGVSTGACIGHVGPEALAGGPIGKIRDGDRIAVVIDRATPGRPRRPGGRVRHACRSGAGARARARRPAPRPRPARRHPALGGPAERQWRNLGRMRLRRGLDCSETRADGWIGLRSDQ